MRLSLGLSLFTFFASLPAGWSYNLVRDHSGQNFFQGWDFYGSWDNLTNGYVWWVDQTNATQQQLAYVDSNGRAIIKVDNTTTLTGTEPDQKRNTIRLTSSDSYDFGSLWIIDIVHLPYGCSVWPAFWTKGPTWPDDGEIDIIEAINLMDHNQMALHTTAGCIINQGPEATGHSIFNDCSKASGCTVAEAKPNSYGPTFNNAGGGVWATQYDETGIFMWFWSRADIPASITAATSTSGIDMTNWGPPSASYPVGPQCSNFTKFFTPQQLVLDITLCGSWAGLQSTYGGGCPGDCYKDSVLGPGSPTYDDAFFEINYVRAYTTGTPLPSSTPTPSSTGGVTVITSTIIDPAPASSSSTSPGKSLANGQDHSAAFSLAAGVFGMILFGATLL